MLYGNSAHVSDGCRQEPCIQNCCQTATDRETRFMLTTYSNSSPYLTVPSPSPYDVVYRMATIETTDKQTTEDRHNFIVP